MASSVGRRLGKVIRDERRQRVAGGGEFGERELEERVDLGVDSRLFRAFRRLRAAACILRRRH